MTFCVCLKLNGRRNYLWCLVKKKSGACCKPPNYLNIKFLSDCFMDVGCGVWKSGMCVSGIWIFNGQPLPNRAGGDFDSRYSQRGVQWAVKQACKQAGIAKDVHVHTLRHSQNLSAALRCTSCLRVL